MTKKTPMKKTLLALAFSISYAPLSMGGQHSFFNDDEIKKIEQLNTKYYTHEHEVTDSIEKITNLGRTSTIISYEKIDYRCLKMPHFKGNTSMTSILNRSDFQPLVIINQRIANLSGRQKEAYKKRYQKAVGSNLYPKTMTLIDLLSEENSSFYAKKSQETQDNLVTTKYLLEEIVNHLEAHHSSGLRSEKPDMNALSPHVNMLFQSHYFFQSLLSLFEEEKKLWPETTAKCCFENYRIVLDRISGILLLGKGSLYQMKGLIDNRISQPLPPQTTPIDPHLYETMDKTDKVCYAYLMAQAEFSRDVLDLLNPLLLAINEMPEAVNYYIPISQMIKDFEKELSYFSLDFLDKTDLETPDFSEETPHIETTIKTHENTQSKSQKKRAAKKRRKTVKMIQEGIQTKDREEKRQREAAPPLSKPSIQNIREEGVVEAPVVFEPYSTWVYRTETLEETREIREHGTAVIAKEARKKAAKLARTKESIPSSTYSGSLNESAIDSTSTSTSTSASEKMTIHKHILAHNHYDTFCGIMDGTYDGEMNPIANMIINGFGGYAQLGSGRIHLTLRDLTTNVQKNCLFLSPISDHTEELVTSTSSSASSSYAKATVHTPHKKGSRRLRPEHVKEIRSLLERAGYTQENVESK